MNASSTANKNSRQQAREDSRRRILEAARSEFAENGFAGTSLDSVAQLAGCSKALVVHYFGGKKKLWQAVVDYYTELADGSLFVQAGKAQPAEGFEQYLRRTFRFFQTHPDYTKIANRLIADKGTPIPQEMFGLLKDVSAAFARAQAAGQIRKDLDPRHVQLMSYTLIASWFSYRDVFRQAWQIEEQEAQDAAYLDDFLALFLRGLAPQDV